MNKVDEYLQSLKNNEYFIKKSVEEIEYAQHKIAEIDDKITKLNDSKINLIPMGIWNENLVVKEVIRTTCIYDTEESVIDKKGGFEYFTDISKDILIDSLNKTKEVWRNIVLEKEAEIDTYISK
jgi:hypothetical protein